MADDLLNIFVGAAEGFEKSAGNLTQIMLAKNRLEQDNQLFKIQKQKGDLDLKELAALGADDDILNTKREMFKLDKKTKEAELEKASLTINAAIAKEKREADTHKAIMNFTLKNGQTGTMLPYGMKYSANGVTITGTKPVEPPVKLQEEWWAEAKRAAKLTTKQTRKGFFGGMIPGEPSAEEIQVEFDKKRALYQKTASRITAPEAGAFDPSARFEEIYKETGSEDEAYQKLAEEMKEKGLSL